MQSNHGINIFERAVGDHGRGAADAVCVKRFFRRLEEEAHVALPAAIGQALLEQVGGTQQHGSV